MNSTVQTATASFRSWADWTGMAASIACGLHCAAMPLILSYLPAFGLGWLAGEGFHRWMTIICFTFAACAFIPGWRKHRSLLPAFSGAIGIFFLSLGAFVFEDECCRASPPSSKNLVQAAGCTDAECPSCVQEVTVEPLESPNSSLQFASFTNWLSPLGGIFLIMGHIANHRKNCTCRGVHCCLDKEEDLNSLPTPESFHG